MTQDDYKFMKIVDATTSINQRVNLISLVVECSLPKTTRGTDFFCTVKIIDQSRQKPGFCINCFAETMDKLPNVRTVGDIILLSNVLVKSRGADIVATFEWRYSAFALYEGNDKGGHEEIVPYQASARYKPREKDKKFILRLRKWLTQIKVECLNEALLFNEIKVGEHLNILCKILHVHEVENEFMVYLWNGTDVPPVSVDSNLDDEYEKPLPLVLDPSPLPRELLCTFPSVGTVLRMKVDRDKEKVGVDYLKTHKWAIFINISCNVCDALWLIVMKPYSKLCYLPDEDARVIQLEKRYHDERFPSKWKRMPCESFPWPSRVTGTEHPEIPFVTLMDILTSSEMICKYKCVVRVVAMAPWRVKDFRNPKGMLRIRLTLEDPTSRIHAHIFAEHGEKFFGRFLSVNAMTNAMNALLGIGDEGEVDVNLGRKPPWIECCMFSYYRDEANMWGSRVFCIFDTILFGASNQLFML